tara:strand:+ start:1503 stop:1733 length:231 start_codon:yes stop_codon:yes gene_type:complete
MSREGRYVSYLSIRGVLMRYVKRQAKQHKALLKYDADCFTVCGMEYKDTMCHQMNVLKAALIYFKIQVAKSVIKYL